MPDRVRNQLRSWLFATTVEPLLVPVLLNSASRPTVECLEFMRYPRILSRLGRMFPQANAIPSFILSFLVLNMP